MANLAKILALDFDGVICDGLQEYFQTTQLTYQIIWGNNLNTDAWAASFCRLRPVIETGWEMPILLRALVLGKTPEEILANWSDIAEEVIKAEKINSKELAEQLDKVRDNWIKSDLDSWLSLHKFYPGIIARLEQIINSSTKLYIVTTKEGRFVNKLLEQAGIKLAKTVIIGKEAKRPKYQTLQEILTVNSEEPANLWFVEDRLKTLISVQQQTDLQQIGLYLADWGYNTLEQRNLAKLQPKIHLLSLAQFNQEFSVWSGNDYS